MQVASKRANLYNPSLTLYRTKNSHNPCAYQGRDCFGFCIDIVLFRAIFCFNLEIIVGAVVVKDLFNTEKYEITSIYDRFYVVEER